MINFSTTNLYSFNKYTNNNLKSLSTPNEILGFGVDKDGYFTSDFNKAANLPSDFKINANKFQNLIKSINSNNIKNAFFADIDYLQSISNAYKLYANLTNDSKENPPKYFQYDFKSFEINKIYQNEDEFMNETRSDKYDFKINSKLEFTEFNLDNKGDALLSFMQAMNNINGGIYGIMQGETTIIGKISGLDKMSVDKMKELDEFL